MSLELQDLDPSMMGRLSAMYNSIQVRRSHAMQVLKDQNLGEHVCGTLYIAQELCAENKIPIPQTLFIFTTLMYHDGAEAVGGDMPAPAKRLFPEFSAGFERLELAFDMGLHLPTLHIPKLSPIQESIVKASDTLDYMFFLLREKRFGNRHPELSVAWNNCTGYLQVHMETAGVGMILRHLTSGWLNVG